VTAAVTAMGTAAVWVEARAKARAQVTATAAVMALATAAVRAWVRVAATAAARGWVTAVLVAATAAVQGDDIKGKGGGKCAGTGQQGWLWQGLRRGQK
jgi:hypothetical protein